MTLLILELPEPVHERVVGDVEGRHVGVAARRRDDAPREEEVEVVAPGPQDRDVRVQILQAPLGVVGLGGA